MIYTHNGLFHADDAMSCAMAQEMGFTEIKRVRELPSSFNESTDIALDIGGKYDGRVYFDHHQKNGASDGRAACGKFWAAYGTQIAGTQDVADRVYLTLLGTIDRSDNGIVDYEPIREDWRHVGLNGFIVAMNPPAGTKPEEVKSAFLVAVAACRQALRSSIAQATIFCSMQEAVASARRISPEIIVLEQGGPWQEHVLDNAEFDDVLYVIYPSERGGVCVQAVPLAAGSFKNRKPLPKTWWGMRGNELKTAANLEEAGPGTFVHLNGFLGGGESFEDALKLAALAVAA